MGGCEFEKKPRNTEHKSMKCMDLSWETETTVWIGSKNMSSFFFSCLQTD